MNKNREKSDVLNSRTSYFSFQRVPKLQAEDQAVWWDTLGKMQKILRKSAASLGAAGKIDKDQMHNYFMSGKIRYINSIAKKKPNFHDTVENI